VDYFYFPTPQYSTNPARQQHPFTLEHFLPIMISSAVDNQTGGNPMKIAIKYCKQ
jgi:hypothetical protein